MTNYSMFKEFVIGNGLLVATHLLHQINKRLQKYLLIRPSTYCSNEWGK